MQPSKAVTVFYLYPRVEKIRVFFLELHESAVLKALAYLLHEGVIEPRLCITHRRMASISPDLNRCLIYAPNVCGRSGRSTRGLSGAGALILCVVEIDYTAHGEKMSVAGIAAGHNAIEKIDAA